MSQSLIKPLFNQWLAFIPKAIVTSFAIANSIVFYVVFIKLEKYYNINNIAELLIQIILAMFVLTFIILTLFFSIYAFYKYKITDNN